MTKRNESSTDERESLLAFLDRQRNGLRNAVYGLTDEEARRVPTVSKLSVAGLLKHAALVERNWASITRNQGAQTDAAKHVASFQPGETPVADLLADYERANAETDEAFLEAKDLNDPVPVPKDVPWFPKDIDAWTVRWVLVHLIEETARHGGHADIIRESIDGAEAFPLHMAANGIPDNPMMKAWRRADES